MEARRCRASMLISQGILFPVSLTIIDICGVCL